MEKFSQKDIEKNKLKLSESTEKLKNLTNDFPTEFKTSHLGNSMTNYANQLDRDLHKLRRRDRKFQYGSIVFVDFGMNFGSEFSGPHYAVTLTRYDTAKNRTITVVPLTSKAGKNNYLLDVNISKEIVNFLSMLSNKKNSEFHAKCKTFEENKKLYEVSQQKGAWINPDFTIPTEAEYIEANNFVDKLDEFLKEMEIFNNEIIQRIQKYKESFEKNTYARIDSITTIDKNKIYSRKGDLDPMGKIKLSELQLYKLSDAISKQILFDNTNQ